MATKPPGVHDIITTLFTRSWLLASASAAVIGAQPVSVQTTQRAEEALQKAEVELADVACVATLGELAASITHEINPPVCHSD